MSLSLGHSFGASETKAIQLKTKTMLRHLMALGSSGSGKTVLSKILVEEMIKNQIPAICIDPQGDLCSLALGLNDEQSLISKGISIEDAKAFQSQVEVVIYTPAARKGVALCADPFFEDPMAFDNEDRVHLISNTASMLCTLLGYDLNSDDGNGLEAVFNYALGEKLKQKTYPKSLNDFASYLSKVSEEENAEFSRFIDPKKLDAARRKLARLDVGANRFLFHEGLPLNIDLLLGKGELFPSPSGKTRLSIIYLNTLNTDEAKDFFIATLTDQLYAWMLKNPSPEPQALFYIDEVAPYIPPVRKPACKQGLTLLFKQARKYGICCLMATQNPGDVDYKAMAQFGTWAIGRLTTKQDIAKIQPTIKSLDPVNTELLVNALPSLKTGEFVLLSPDEFQHAVFLKTRWLYGQHKTLDDQAIAEIHHRLWGEHFDQLEEKLKGQATNKAPQSKALKSANQQSAQALVEDKQAPQSKSMLEAQHQEKTVFDTLAQSKALSEGIQEKEESGKEDKIQNVALLVENDLEALKKKASLIFKTNTALTAQEYASISGLSLDKSKKALEKLKEIQFLKSWEKGRSIKYFSVEAGYRPDIELPNQVMVIQPRIVADNEVKKLAESLNSKGVMGLFSTKDLLIQQDLCHKLLLKVSFSQIVERGFFDKWVLFKSTGKQNGSLYLDPKTLFFISYQPHSKLTFLENKEGDTHAIDIEDFDGNVTITDQAPGTLVFDESDWVDRASDSKIEKAIEKRFQSKVTKIEPIFLPIWKCTFESRKQVIFNALTGESI